MRRSAKSGLSLIIIDPAGMVPLVVLRRTKKPESARGGTCRDHAINGPRSWTTQSRGTPAIDAQRLNWLRRRRAIRSGGGVSVQLEHDSPEVKIRTWKKELS